MNQKILELLYRSFDGQLTVEEQRQLDKALSGSQALQEEKEAIATIRRAVSNSATQTFKPFFAEKTMQHIRSRSEKAAKFEEVFNLWLWSFRRLALAGTLAIILLLVINVMSIGNLSIDSALVIPQLTIDDAWDVDFF